MLYVRISSIREGLSIAYRAINDILGARLYPGVSPLSRNPYLYGTLFSVIFLSALFAAYGCTPVFDNAAVSPIWLPNSVLLCGLLKSLGWLR